MTFGKCCSHNNNKEIVFQFDTVSKEERERKCLVEKIIFIKTGNCLKYLINIRNGWELMCHMQTKSGDSETATAAEKMV